MYKMDGGQRKYEGTIIVEYSQPFVLVGTHIWINTPFVFAPRRPLEQRAELLSGGFCDPSLLGQALQCLPRFNLIEHAEKTVTNPPERNGTLDCSDARTGDRTETRERHDDRPELDEAVVRGGSKPHAAPLEHTDKSAGEISI